MESFFALLQKNVLDRRRWTTRQKLRMAIPSGPRRAFTFSRQARGVVMSVYPYLPLDGVREQLLNSLCSFDLWQCVGASIRQETGWGSAYYPSFASFLHERIAPSLRVMVADRQARQARQEAFNGADDQKVREHLLKVVEAAHQQALNSGSFHWGLTFNWMTQELIDKHLPGR